MKNLTFRFLTAILTFIVGITIAYIWYINRLSPNTEIESQIVSVENPAPLPPAPSGGNQPSPPGSPIRRVDFNNFTYPRLPTGKCSMSRVRVRNGSYGSIANFSPSIIPRGGCWSVDVAPIEYGDVTGDGLEEAMVVLYAELGGTENSEDVFIYTLRNGRPVSLWKFATGSGAHGGLRRIYADSGELVVELGGEDKIIGRDLYADNEILTCDDCPTVFTRTRYQWSNGRFRQRGEVEILPFTGWQ